MTENGLFGNKHVILEGQLYNDWLKNWFDLRAAGGTNPSTVEVFTSAVFC